MHDSANWVLLTSIYRKGKWSLDNMKVNLVGHDYFPNILFKKLLTYHFTEKNPLVSTHNVNKFYT